MKIEDMNDLRIVQLSAENFLRLSCVQIRPRGNVVEVVGKNGAGKSSALNAIAVCLEGMAAAPSVPIRKGATEARITLDLGEVIVRRTFRRKDGDEVTTSLTLENAEGARFPSPQRMLDQLRGNHSLDPLAFLRMKPGEQFDALRAFVPNVDFEKIESQNRGDFERRTDFNRFARQEHAAAQAIVLPAGATVEPADDAAIARELEEAGEANAERERRQANRTRTAEQALALHGNANALLRQAEDLDRQAQAMRQEATTIEAEAKTLEKKLEEAQPLPERIETQGIMRRLDAARATNETLASARRRAKHIADAERYAAQANDLTASIDKRNAEMAAAIASSAMPVKGLGFGDGAVLMNGLPFAQASMAEQLRTSVAIAMAMKPKIRVIWIHDASLLDADSMRIVAEMAEANGFQVWLERVQTDSKFGFVLEDGRVVEQEDEPKAANA